MKQYVQYKQCNNIYLMYGKVSLCNEIHMT